MLTLKQINNLPLGRHQIEPNLYVRVRDEKNRYFTFLYSFNKSRKELTFGNVNDVSLKIARQKAQQCRLLLSQGIDPKARRDEFIKQSKLKEEQQRREKITLKDYYDSILPLILNAKQLHGEKSKQYYTRLPYIHIMPTLGSRPVSGITTEDVAQCLKPLWETKPPTGKKMRIVLEIIFHYAKKQRVYVGDNPATFKYNLDIFLPSLTKIHETQHRRYASNEELLRFCRHIAVWHWWYPRALIPPMVLLTALLACRSVECCDLSWTEIDFNKRLITLPKERKKFKTGPAFQIPLSNQAIFLLNQLRALNPKNKTGFVFLRPSGKKLHADNARKFMRTMPTCLHGFRTSFRNWCVRNAISDNVAELCLMHSIGRSETERAYLRDDLMDLRAEAMQKWADFILPMDVLTGDFLTEDQRELLTNIPYHEKGRGWQSLWENRWNLNL